MSLRIPKVDEDTIAHVFRYKPTEAAHRLSYALLVGRNDLAEVLGSMRAESAVEPTRSENITVIWRRSAASFAEPSIVAGAPAWGAWTFASIRSAAMAASSLRRCPTMPTPRSFKSSAVRFGRTVASISLSRNAASVARSSHGDPTDQGRCRRARQQNCSDGLGHDGARREIQRTDTNDRSVTDID